MKIGGREVGDGHPAFVLAEVASAHQGEVEKAIALASAASDARADGVKFQIFRASELIAPGDPRSSTFQQIELSFEEWERVLDHGRRLGIPIFIEVFDRPSLSFAEKHDVAAYKIHSTDIENPEFIRAVAATGRPLLMSSGGSSLAAVQAAIEVARREGNESIMLLHGVQNFPTRVEDSHLRFLETLKESFGFPVGFLDHVDGGSPMALLLPALAVAFGANLVEKHMTLDRAAKGFDYESALEKEAFSAMIDRIRETERALGSATLPSGEGAEKYHRLMRRAVVSRVELRAGEPLTRDQVALLRNENGLPPRDLPSLLGRRPRRRVSAWEPLTEDLFE
jgi:sialic acid synthase SpsE